MSLKLYMDVHIPHPITHGLQKSGIDVLTAQEDGASEWADEDLLNRAFAIDRIMVSYDSDFLRDAKKRQQTGQVLAA